MLDQITPVVLTYNEEPNIARTLNKLRWAKDIVVVDSGSTDRTQEIARGFPQVRVIERPFDSHARQWSFAVHETGIRTDWVLALDADYVFTDAGVKELTGLKPQPSTGGYHASFRYCVQGRLLRGTLYPPVTVLVRREKAQYKQDGHTQRVVVAGEVLPLSEKIHHDDRKPLSSWLWAQDRYMTLEAHAISQTTWSDLSWTDRIRKLVVFAPPLTFVYCLLIKGGLLDGWPGFYYAAQRTVAELILSLKLIEQSTCNSNY